MSITTSLLAFFAAAGLLTLTPGLDTVLVVRTRLAAGPRAAFAAAVGVGLGCLVWGTAVAVGLGAVLAAAPMVYAALRWCGAAYLLWCGLVLIARPRRVLDTGTAGVRPEVSRGYLGRGLLTNLLNPKIGLFYLSFLPQFVPAGVPSAPFMVLLTVIHVVMGLVWFGVLIGSMALVRRVLVGDTVLPWLDRLTGGVFVGLGVKLALDRA